MEKPPLAKKRILVAVDDCERLERILAGHILTIPHSVEEAERELQAREYHMVILGVLFDESRMFELLRLVRTFKMNALTPVVCMLTGTSNLSAVAINLHKFPDDPVGHPRRVQVRARKTTNGKERQ